MNKTTEPCLCGDHVWHRRALRTLSEAIESPPDCPDFLNCLIQEENDSNRILAAMQHWIDFALESLPEEICPQGGTFGFALMREAEDPSFTWATGIMGARANGDEEMFIALLDTIKDGDQLTQGICSTLFLCAMLFAQAETPVYIAPPIEFDESQVPRP